MSAEHPNAAGVRRVFDAFAGGDQRALLELIAEDAVWRVPGSAPVSRVYEGREQIFELFRLTRRLTGGSYLSRLLWTLADDEHAVAVYRATGEREGRTLDIEQVLLIGLQDSRWADVLALPADPAAFATFWS